MNELPACAACRSDELLQTACTLIAREGFEGLRTRAVAQAAGINVATLHYYFASKASLIAGVARYLDEQFRRQKAPAVPETGSHLHDLLQQIRADAEFRRQHCPELKVVMQEFLLRSRRDPDVYEVLQGLQARWRAELAEQLAGAQNAGELRTDIDIGVMATMLHAQLVGLFCLGEDAVGMDGLLRAFERMAARVS